MLVCHENRGLTPHIEDVARRFAKAGYVALAPDLLSREGGTAALHRDAVPGALTRAGAHRHAADFAAAFCGPAPDLAKVPGIKAAALGVYAELDQRITGGMPALEDALEKSGVVHRLTVYPGVDHAFHNDTGDRYNEAQATAAWNDTLAWLAEHV